MSLIEAGVLLPVLTKQNKISLDSRVILTLRSQTVEHHKGQISFPGGMFEPENDQTLLDTALRETHEEIGIPRNLILIQNELPKIPTASSKFLITPFVGTISISPTYVLNEHEIEKIIEIPLFHFLDPQNSKEEIFEREKLRIKMKSYFFEEHRIWGATALILQTWLEKYLTIPTKRG